MQTNKNGRKRVIFGTLQVIQVDSPFSSSFGLAQGSFAPLTFGAIVLKTFTDILKYPEKISAIRLVATRSNKSMRRTWTQAHFPRDYVQNGGTFGKCTGLILIHNTTADQELSVSNERKASPLR